MNSSKFAEGYRRDDIDFREQDPDLLETAGKEFMEGPYKWSKTFSTLTWEYLSGEPIDHETTKTNLMRYSTNSVQRLIQNTRAHLQEWGYLLPPLIPPLDTLNFHAINSELLRYWDLLVDPDENPPLGEADVSVMQARLSIKALELVAIRRMYQKKSRSQGIRSPIDKPLARHIGETDAAIALLEFIKQRTNDGHQPLALLPLAPHPGTPKNPAAHMHYIVLDPHANQAQGVQVTTRPSTPEGGISSLVSTINTYDDLRDFYTDSSSRLNPVRKALPGLLAADFLLNNPIGKIANASHTEGLEHIQGRLIEARRVAYDVFPRIENPGRMAKISKSIGTRIINDLYKN